MGMKTYEELRTMLCEELEEIANKGTLSMGDLDAVHKLTGAVKNIDKIEMMEEDGYSHDGGWRAEGMYSRTGGMNSYDGGMYGGDSYRESYRGGNSYANRKRDSRGRYSRAGEDMMAQKIEDMMTSGRMSADEQETLQKALEMIRK